MRAEGGLSALFTGLVQLVLTTDSALLGISQFLGVVFIIQSTNFKMTHRYSAVVEETSETDIKNTATWLTLSSFLHLVISEF